MKYYIVFLTLLFSTHTIACKEKPTTPAAPDTRTNNKATSPSFRKVTQYNLVRAWEREDDEGNNQLTVRVNQAIANGWQPTTGPIRYRPWSGRNTSSFYQPMAKYNSSTSPTIRKVTEYTWVRAANYSDFNGMVNKHISNGWQPLGDGPTVEGGFLLAMVKYDRSTMSAIYDEMDLSDMPWYKNQ